MSMDQATVRYTGVTLTPKYRPHMAKRRPLAFAPNQVIDYGTVIGVTSTNTADVQTFTATGTPTGGNFSFTVINPVTLEVLTLTIPFNCTSAQLQVLANPIWNQQISSVVTNIANGVDTTTTVNNMTAGGGPWPGTPLTLTGSGILKFGAVPVAVAGINAFTGGSSPAASVAHTTVGSIANVGVIYNATVLTPPSTGPTLTAASGSTSWVAGLHTVTYTLVTAGGESTPSPATGVVLTATQQINVTSITGLNAAVTSVNFYVDGYFCQNAAVTTGATGAVSLVTATLTGKPSPDTNTAYTSPNGAGSQIAQFITEYPIATDANGRITYGNVTGGVPPWMYTDQTCDVFINGEFDLGDLKGLDANALNVQVPSFGRISEGSLASGVGTLSVL